VQREALLAASKHILATWPIGRGGASQKARSALDEVRKQISGLVKNKPPSNKSANRGVGDEDTDKPKLRRRRPMVVEEEEEITGANNKRMLLLASCIYVPSYCM
jgi:hypothetical protein